jgi:transcription initiation factor TFIIE subunit beta
VFVTRTLKDGQMRMVFWNEVKVLPAALDEDAPMGGSTGLGVEKGASPFGPAPLSFPHHCIKEFNDLWHALKVPNDVDLLKQLASGASLLFAYVHISPADLMAGCGRQRGYKRRRLRLLCPRRQRASGGERGPRRVSARCASRTRI